MRKITLLIVVLISILNVSCSRDDNIHPAQNAEVLTAEENAVIEAIPSVENLNDQTVILPNGISLHDYLEEVDPQFNVDWNTTNSRVE